MRTGSWLPWGPWHTAPVLLPPASFTHFLQLTAALQCGGLEPHQGRPSQRSSRQAAVQSWEPCGSVAGPGAGESRPPQ